MLWYGLAALPAAGVLPALEARVVIPQRLPVGTAGDECSQYAEGDTGKAGLSLEPRRSIWRPVGDSQGKSFG